MLLKKPADVAEAPTIQYNRKYGLYFYADANEEPISLVVELPNVFTVEDCIKYSLDQFNKENQTLKLQWNQEQYQLRVAKKNGKPKDDLPALDFEQVLIETGASLFAIIRLSKPVVEVEEIKPRTSYNNSLTSAKSKKPSKSKDQQNGGFCFFNCG